MKEIKPDRFKKGGEEITFNQSASPHDAVDDAEGPFDRSNARTNVATTAITTPAYIVQIPQARRKTRQTFDIFEDQYDALKKLQIAQAEQANEKTGPTLGTLVQDALDAFIKERGGKLANMSIIRE